MITHTEISSTIAHLRQADLEREAHRVRLSGQVRRSRSGMSGRIPRTNAGRSGQT